jgi:hypothetical protein
LRPSIFKTLNYKGVSDAMSMSHFCAMTQHFCAASAIAGGAARVL